MIEIYFFLCTWNWQYEQKTKQKKNFISFFLILSIGRKFQVERCVRNSDAISSNLMIVKRTIFICIRVWNSKIWWTDIRLESFYSLHRHRHGQITDNRMFSYLFKATGCAFIELWFRLLILVFIIISVANENFLFHC